LRSDGFLLIDYLPKGQTNIEEYYSSLMVRLKDISKEKPSGKFAKLFLFLHDNAPAHRAFATQNKLVAIFISKQRLLLPRRPG
jgi:hypothetical protein